MSRPEHQTRRVVAGTACIAAVLVVAGGIIFLQDIRSALRRTYHLIAIFPEAAAITVDSPVLLAGKPVGRVRHVGLLPVDHDTLSVVSVTISLPRRVQPMVPRGSRARLTAVNLIGERVVDIIPADERAPPLAHGDTLEVRRPPRAELLRQRQREIQTELDSLQHATATLQRMWALREPSLEPVVRELDRARAEAASLAATVREGPIGSGRSDELRAAFTRVRGHVNGVRESIDALGRVSDETGVELRDAAAALFVRIETLQLAIASLEASLENTDGFAGRLAQDTALLVAVRGTRTELDSLIAAVKRNPFRFFRIRL